MAADDTGENAPARAATAVDAESATNEAARQIGEAARAQKCWSCGCLHDTLAALEKMFPGAGLPPALSEAAITAQARLSERRYDCLGCEICYPALAVNALSALSDDFADAACPAAEVNERRGWPPLPGSYQVIRYRAPVAICTLNDEELRDQLASRNRARATSSPAALIGTLRTENLGLERVITNLLANPNIRFLILCGPDSRQRIGHLPGQTLLALAANGIDERGAIAGARGKRPVLRNITHEAVAHFRETVEVVDLIDCADLPEIMEAAHRCAARHPGPAEAFSGNQGMTATRGYCPERMQPDPKGYFVIDVDRARSCLALEHYSQEGVLDTLIEGHAATELYWPAIERGLLSRLDHAAYLGKELARAEHALKTGEEYIQDGVPEREPEPAAKGGCGCSDRKESS